VRDHPATAPKTVLSKLEFEAAPAPDWPKGVYCFGADVLRVGLVVASELRPGDTTLLVRMMAAGPLLAQAVEELAALPADAYERVITEPALAKLSRHRSALSRWPRGPRFELRSRCSSSRSEQLEALPRQLGVPE
jgi:hypothetical protein